jgi:hypothetical protein
VAAMLCKYTDELWWLIKKAPLLEKAFFIKINDVSILDFELD